MILTRNAPIDVDKASSSKSNNNNNTTLRSLLSKTVPWSSRRDQVKRDPSSTTIQATEDSLDGTEDLESISLHLVTSCSHNSTPQNFSMLDESSDDNMYGYNEENIRHATERSKSNDNDLDGQEKHPRRGAVKGQVSHRVTRRRNSITAMSTFEVEPEMESNRSELDVTSQHSSTSNVARGDRRRTTRPRRRSLGYAGPASSTESSEFKELLQKRLDRIEKQRSNSFDNSQSILYGYEGEEGHDSSSNLAPVSQATRRCGRRARRHSIGTISSLADGSSLLSIKGTANVDAEYGYEDPDCPTSSCDDPALVRRQVRNIPRRARRLSVGHSPEKRNDEESFELGVEGNSNVLKNEGTTTADPDHGYEDPDASESNCDASGTVGRQVRNLTRRPRRVSVGKGAGKGIQDESLEFVTDRPRESFQRRERRRSMHV